MVILFLPYTLMLPQHLKLIFRRVNSSEVSISNKTYLMHYSYRALCDVDPVPSIHFNAAPTPQADVTQSK
jgi:hypothetical protein